MKLTEKFLSTTDLRNLRRADQVWEQLRCQTPTVTPVIHTTEEPLGQIEFDVVIAGGTLGIFLGATLQKQGWKVAILERGILKGREQEWNISRHELKTFIDLEILTPEQLETAIVTEYNPARVSFDQGYELWVNDVLNVGVDPVYLLATLKEKFLESGGKLFENTPFQTATIAENGVEIRAGEHCFTSRLLIDGMGHFSPIAKQARNGQKPDAVCLVVGSCAEGYPENDTGDLIVSFTPIQHQCQYFWEAFPAKDGRTTYLFTYLDAEPERFSLEFLMSEYLRLLPEYQNIDLEALEFKRFLFGFFPAYQNSPLRLPWHRLLAIGDSSGSQSPVSFGGFGAMVRHLERLTTGISEALTHEALTASDLAWLQPYQPNIAVTWLFQKTMSVKLQTQAKPDQINRLMSGVFRVMDKLGNPILKPFLQDVIQFSGLTRTLPLVNPLLVLPLFPQIGLLSLLDWSRHYFNLGLYQGLYRLGKLLQPLTQNWTPKQQYYYHRWLDQWQYGSGQDYQQS